MKRTRKWLKTPAGIAVGTTVLAFVLTVCYDLVKTKPVLTTIWAILQGVWRFILSFLNFQLRVWWILLGIAGIILIFYVIFKVDELKHSGTNLPQFLQYKKDKIKNWSWEWDWEKHYDGKYWIENLHPVCPHCNTPLVCGYGTYVCPRCDRRELSTIPDFETIKILISDNVEKGQIPKRENDKD
mgnify:CR=1 FL=1